MQNKHLTFFLLLAAQLTGRGEGPLVGPKAQVFPKKYFDGTPKPFHLNDIIQMVLSICLV